MDNTESSDSVYVNTEEVENPDFIENSGVKEWQGPPVYLHRRKYPWITHLVIRVMGVHHNDLK